ncbi:MAG: 16S rRNA (cytosine(1402)-N(4))-methyltransferase RsmH [Planctomycetota bacterium]
MSLPQHIPVMPTESLDALALHPGAVAVDGTLGGGGHTVRMLEAVGPQGRVVAIDRDPQAVASAEANISDPRLHLVHGSYADLPEILVEFGLERGDALLLDLGLSSDQLADESRGFSFQAEGELDLRFDPTRGEPAWRLLERLSEKHLADAIYAYGEERHSRRIARRIVEVRRQQPIRTADQLAEIARRCVPRSKNHRIHPATRTFQALRILVNEELDTVATALRRIPEAVRVGGRVAIISFHSLEDRLVKNAFRDDPRYEVLTKKPLQASESEVACNPRARSAKLRIAEITACTN